MQTRRVSSLAKRDIPGPLLADLQKIFRCISLGGRPNTHAEKTLKYAEGAGEYLVVSRTCLLCLTACAACFCCYSSCCWITCWHGLRLTRRSLRPTPESRWATRGISVSRSSRRPWLPISPQYRFTNCQPGIPTAASTARVRSAPLATTEPSPSCSSSAAGLPKWLLRGHPDPQDLRGATQQHPEHCKHPTTTHARADPALGTHPHSSLCLSRPAVGCPTSGVCALLRCCAAAGPLPP